MLTKQQLEEIRARAEKATKGPWEADTNDGDCVVWGPGDEFLMNIGETVQLVQVAFDVDVNNAEFVAHARFDVPALLAEVERLRERNEKLERVAETGKECLNGVGMAHYPHNVHVDYNKYESLRDALSALDEQEAGDTESCRTSCDALFVSR